MRDRDIKTAERFGILERCKAFENDLLKIKGIVPDRSDDGIPFSLDGFLSGIYQVIIVPQYDLYLSEDRIGDMRAHFYFVFTCGQTWRNQKGLDGK